MHHVISKKNSISFEYFCKKSNPNLSKPLVHLFIENTGSRGMCWRRQWHPTPAFLPGESQGWASLVGCCLWGRTELDTTEATQQQQPQQRNVLNHISCMQSLKSTVWEIVHPSYSQSVVCKPVTLLSSESLLEMLIFRPHPWPAASDSAFLTRFLNNLLMPQG